MLNNSQISINFQWIQSFCTIHFVLLNVLWNIECHFMAVKWKIFRSLIWQDQQTLINASQEVLKASWIFYQSYFEHFGHQTIVNKRLNASTIALLECPPPWNSMVPKASVGLSWVCLLMDHFSDKLSFFGTRSDFSFWLDEMLGGRPTCWPISRPQQHLWQKTQPVKRVWN